MFCLDYSIHVKRFYFRVTSIAQDGKLSYSELVDETKRDVAANGSNISLRLALNNSNLRGVPESHGIKGGVGAVVLQELGVGALLDDAPGLQDDDVVGSFDGRETVGDDERGTPV